MSDDAELRSLKEKMERLKEREAQQKADREVQWSRYAEQDKYYREMEARQAALDEWSQELILKVKAETSQQIARELEAVVEEEERQLMLPPIPDHQRRYDEERHREKTSKVRDAAERKAQLAIRDRSPGRVDE